MFPVCRIHRILLSFLSKWSLSAMQGSPCYWSEYQAPRSDDLQKNLITFQNEKNAPIIGIVSIKNIANLVKSLFVILILIINLKEKKRRKTRFSWIFSQCQGFSIVDIFPVLYQIVSGSVKETILSWQTQQRGIPRYFTEWRMLYIRKG